MSQKPRKWVVALIELDTERHILEDLPTKEALSLIPDALCDAVEQLSPEGGLELDRIYLVSEENRRNLLELLEADAIDYQTFVDQHTDEVCRAAGCPVHAKGRLIHLSSWAVRKPGPPN